MLKSKLDNVDVSSIASNVNRDEDLIALKNGIAFRPIPTILNFGVRFQLLQLRMWWL